MQVIGKRVENELIIIEGKTNNNYKLFGGDDTGSLGHCRHFHRSMGSYYTN